jgi:PAS domain S-box-containing protein
MPRARGPELLVPCGAALVLGILAGGLAVRLGGALGVRAPLPVVAVHAAVLVSAAGAAVLVWRRRDREARRAGDALARQALALRVVGDAVMVLDGDARVTDWNGAAERMYGWTAEEATGRVVFELLGSLPIGQTPEEIVRRLRSGGGRSVFESLHRRKDGTELQVEIVASPASGHGLAVFAARDVTAQRRTERALRESEERLSLAVAGSGIGVWDWDRRAERFYLDPEWARRLAAPERLETFAEVMRVLVHPDDIAAVSEANRVQLAAGMVEVESEHRCLLAGGAVAWIQLRGRVSERDADGAPVRYTGTIRDVTEARALRERLEQSDRLASLGTLAAGIAHEVNNPVAYVAANLAYVKEHLDAGGGRPDAELRQAVDEAISGAARVREIVAGLKQFAAPAERVPQPVDVRAEIDAAIGMTRHEIAHRARLAVDVAERLPPVLASPAVLGQVLVNLLVNAAHAIPEGRPAEHEVRLVARAIAGRVEIEVSDTGVGIPPDLLPRVFDPFFTTKPVGGGTGLGLSICHGIVNSNGGTIEVASAPGQGSTFRVVLPAAREVAAVPADPAQPPAFTRGRILVVDDEPLVGRALGRILRADHDVVVTTSPLDALERLERGERYDVVLCDLMMPELSGMELEARIARATPNMVGRIVFMTGGAFTPAARAFLEGGRPHVEKPIDSAALRAVLAERLAS